MVTNLIILQSLGMLSINCYINLLTKTLNVINIITGNRFSYNIIDIIDSPYYLLEEPNNENVSNRSNREIRY
jgi:hypothetical protein